MQLRLNSGLTNAVKVNQGLRDSAGGPPKSLQGYRGETEEKDQRYTGGTPEVYRNNTVASAYHLPGMSNAQRSLQAPHTGFPPDRRQVGAALHRHRRADIPVRSNSRMPVGAARTLVRLQRCCGQECPRAGLGGSIKMRPMQVPACSARLHLLLSPALLSPYVQAFEGSPSGCRLRRIACARRAAQT